MSADQDLRRAVGDLAEQRAAGGALLAPGQNAHSDAGGCRQATDRREVLASEYLGRRHQCRLTADLDRLEHRHARDDRLAAADVSLAEAKHSVATRQVATDLRACVPLRRGRGQIGRAPCWVRVCGYVFIWVVSVAF